MGCNQESLRFIETSDIKNNIEIFVSILSDDEKLIGTLDSNNNKIYLDENNLGSIARVILSSFIVVFIFYSMPIIINFTNAICDLFYCW